MSNIPKWSRIAAYADAIMAGEQFDSTTRGNDTGKRWGDNDTYELIDREHDPNVSRIGRYLLSRRDIMGTHLEKIEFDTDSCLFKVNGHGVLDHKQHLEHLRSLLGILASSGVIPASEEVVDAQTDAERIVGNFNAIVGKEFPPIDYDEVFKEMAAEIGSIDIRED